MDIGVGMEIALKMSMDAGIGIFVQLLSLLMDMINLISMSFFIH